MVTMFAADADCVGLTKRVPWEMNRLWLDLVARSGTPLFVSAAPDRHGARNNRLELRILAAAAHQPVAEPLDWLETHVPADAIEWASKP